MSNDLATLRMLRSVLEQNMGMKTTGFVVAENKVELYGRVGGTRVTIMSQGDQGNKKHSERAQGKRAAFDRPARPTP